MKEEKVLLLGARSLLLALAILAGTSALAVLPQQKPDMGHDRDRGRAMLDIIKDDLKEGYYDPKFHGLDIDAKFKAAKEKINSATSNGQIFSIIAQVLIELNDSHTFFIPPDRVVDTDYGWEIRMIGDVCYVVDVTPGSDAEAKGVRVGDEVWSIDGFQPTRQSLWKINYSYYTLKPRAGMRLVLRSPAGGEREVDVMAHIVKGRERLLLAGQHILWERSRFSEFKDELIVWKFPSFEIDPKEIDEAMKRVAPFKSLILDLRGNGGGLVDTLLRLSGYFFDHDIKIADAKTRKSTKPLTAKTRGENIFKGKLIVLIDSDSGSASELFARLIQIEKRGTIIGDRSAGAVMRSKLLGEADVVGSLGEEGDTLRITPFAVSITEANLLMSDGQSLEGVGVVPDVSLLPNGSDLAAHRDVLLARAAGDCGVTLAPADAGALFPTLRLKPDEAADNKNNDKKKKDKNDKKKEP